ncbi:50S ribosomal protein L13 [Candidatus Poribacteria bacterium]|nr:50S ribosomal protein L13 [Candidatus Poribacteria bacterium]
MKAQVSTLPNVNEMPERWFLVDAEGQILGRVAARIASLLRGKKDVNFSPHLNPRIHVVVINVDKVVLTGRKLQNKIYYHHSGWRTGIKSISAGKLMQEKPSEALRKAIHGMLPKNRLGVTLNKNVKLYAGTEHPHAAQNPEPLAVKTRQPRRIKI